MSRSFLKFRGGNDDRNGIYSSLTEVISDAVSFVNPLHDALAKNALEAHEMTQTVLKNSTFNGYDIFFDAANPISGKGIQLRSPTPIYIYFSL